MPQNWHTIAASEAKSDYNVPVPETVRESVGFTVGSMVWWNYEKHARFAVVSDSKFERDNYEPVDFRRVYGPEGYEKIRPPVKTSEDKPDFPEDILSNFSEGTELFFLLYEDMVQNEKKSAFLLTRSQVIKLLPKEAGEDGTDLEKRIMNTPGFLPSI